MAGNTLMESLEGKKSSNKKKLKTTPQSLSLRVWSENIAQKKNENLKFVTWSKVKRSSPAILVKVCHKIVIKIGEILVFLLKGEKGNFEREE